MLIKKATKLTYTKEMKEQDKLWKLEKEDSNLMEKLFHQIVNEAKGKGFTGYCSIYQTNNECICEVFHNKEEYEKASLSGESIYYSFGFCKAIIEELEKRINLKENI